MAHSLIIGQTESGKSTLARQLADQYKSSGVGVIVLDGSRDQWPSADYVAHDIDDFNRCAVESRRCALFIDEAGESVSWLAKDAVSFATKYRHYGHFCHFIAQGPTMIAPNIRRNCTRLFLFAVSREDALMLAREWTHDEIRDAHTLRRGEFLALSRFDPPRRMRLF